MKRIFVIVIVLAVIAVVAGFIFLSTLSYEMYDETKLVSNLQGNTTIVCGQDLKVDNAPNVCQIGIGNILFPQSFVAKDTSLLMDFTGNGTFPIEMSQNYFTITSVDWQNGSVIIPPSNYTSSAIPLLDMPAHQAVEITLRLGVPPSSLSGPFVVQFFIFTNIAVPVYGQYLNLYYPLELQVNSANHQLASF